MFGWYRAYDPLRKYNSLWHSDIALALRQFCTKSLHTLYYPERCRLYLLHNWHLVLYILFNIIEYMLTQYYPSNFLAGHKSVWQEYKSYRLLKLTSFECREIKHTALPSFRFRKLNSIIIILLLQLNPHAIPIVPVMLIDWLVQDLNQRMTLRVLSAKMFMEQ